MKFFALFIIGLSAISLSTALDQNQINTLLELNFMFDVIHKNYDNQINIAWNTQKHNAKVLNAQFLSRYGFSAEEVKDKEAEVLAAIEARGQEIGNQQAECLELARQGLRNAVGYAGMNYQAIAGEILFYFNEISDSFFYPLVEVLHVQSNSFQWEVLNALQNINPVSNMDQLIQRLRDDYYVIILLYENAIANLQSEIRLYNTQFNSVRSSTFQTFRSVNSYYTFTANMLIDTLPACTE